MINADSMIGETIAQKKNSRSAKSIIDIFFIPNGGSVATNITFWQAAENHDKKTCLQMLLDKLNKMPNADH